MNEDNPIQQQEDKLISQAKKRLVGACVILLILLIAAPLVLKNRNEKDPTEPIKITMESSPVIKENASDNVKPNETNQKSAEASTPLPSAEPLAKAEPKIKSDEKKMLTTQVNNRLHIQIGIFSDNEKIKLLQQKINSLGYQTKTETVKVGAVGKIRLITDEFKTESLAKEALFKFKNAGVPGILKKINS
ncbi:MAG: hypothetical protein EXR41_02080 [Candidatus Methylopumilus sp.]|nr:hypothetical protein [Candidatus Methylopumilus sp.]